MLIKAIFRLMGGGRRHMRYAYAQKFQNMSEEERSAFMKDNANRWNNNCCGWNSSCEPTINENKTTNS